MYHTIMFVCVTYIIIIIYIAHILLLLLLIYLLLVIEFTVGRVNFLICTNIYYRPFFFVKVQYSQINKYICEFNLNNTKARL